MTIRCGGCRNADLAPGTVAQYPASGLTGLENVTFYDVPALVCPACGAAALEGPVLEACERHLALAIATRGALTPAELRYLRGVLGHTQAELAARLGVDRTTVARWETADGPLGARESLGVRALVGLHLARRESPVAEDIAQRVTAPPADGYTGRGYSVRAPVAIRRAG